MTASISEGDTPPRFLSPKALVRQLRDYLKEKDISYGEVARAMGHQDSSQVSRWMNLRVEPRLSSLTDIQKAIEKIEKARKN